MRDVADSLRTMRRRKDFVAATSGATKIGGPLIGLQMMWRADGDSARVGFTVTKRVGHAVERNRMKRRLREAARLGLAQDALPGCDYVVVARRAVLDARFGRLVRDLRDAAKRAAGKDRRNTPAAPADAAGQKNSSPTPGLRESGR